MPRENKKRGRRGEQQQKRKLEDAAEDDHDQQKRQRLSPSDQNDAFAEQHEYQPIEDSTENHHEDASDRPFFGMLEEAEQEYFRKADEMLELNDFAGPDERNLFIANVYREANGKELKIANSQSCSRLMERLIKLSSPEQLKTLFQKFHGNFVHLMQHRFASHCCEKLFIQSAPTVTQELLHPSKSQIITSPDEVVVSMETLLLHTVEEIQDSVGYCMTDRFASHTLRILLLVLAGESTSSPSSKSLVQSKKKEDVTVDGVNGDVKTNGTHDTGKLTVPDSFEEALHKLMTASVAGLDTNGLRALATHQLGNPTLQLLLRLELTHFGKQRAKDQDSLLRKLLPDDNITPDSDSANFINALIYDPIGSHLVETIIEYAPGKLFKTIYRDLLKDRIGSLARNEIAGYVLCKVLERLSRDDLYEAHEAIVPQIQPLLERNRMVVVKTLIQRCAVREIDTQTIAVQIDGAFKSDQGFDVSKLLKLDEVAVPNGDSKSTDDPERAKMRSDPAKVQGSILAQAMILVPGPLSSLVFESLAQQSPAMLQQLASDSVASRTLQAAMTSTNASIIARRKLVQHFYGHIGEMAAHRTASRVVDAIWEGTHGLAFIRERIAEELAENESALRNSPSGRAVWKNWKMDLYKRRRQEWIAQSKVKASNDGFQSFTEVDKNKEKMNQAVSANKPPVTKTPIELARERHASRSSRRREAVPS